MTILNYFYRNTCYIDSGFFKKIKQIGFNFNILTWHNFKLYRRLTITTSRNNVIIKPSSNIKNRVYIFNLSYAKVRFLNFINCLSIDLVGGDTTASVNGLALSVSAVGEVAKDKLVRRSGAKVNDLVCITSDLGAAYMGLHLLERERIALDGHPNPNPDFKGHEYILRRWLKPDLRLDIIKALEAEGIVPSAMIDITDGLASDALQICKASGCGVRLYLERVPIAAETRAMAEELNADPIVAMLNGGDDYELLFTVPLEMRDKVLHFGGVDVIGHITEWGAVLVTPEGGELPLTAPGVQILCGQV